MRYDVVFLDVDETLLWVDMDVEGYIRDLAPYATDGIPAVEEAHEPIWKSLRQHINENINYRTEEELARFRRENARNTAHALGFDAPEEILAKAWERGLLFNPYPEAEAVMKELREMGLPLYVVSNWDVELEKVLTSLGWTRYFSGIVASAVVGSEKPERTIFEEALALAGVSRSRTVHVGNDPISDVQGATAAGIDAVLVNRKGEREVPEAVAILPDLSGLPALVKS